MLFTVADKHSWKPDTKIQAIRFILNFGGFLKATYPKRLPAGARSGFYSMITYPNTYFPLNWNILTSFCHFSISFVPFYDILCKLSSFMRIYAFKRTKTSRRRCVYNHGNSYLFRFTYTYMQITVHPPDFAGNKNVDFEFPDAFLFGHPFGLAIKIL